MATLELNTIAKDKALEEWIQLHSLEEVYKSIDMGMCIEYLMDGNRFKLSPTITYSDTTLKGLLKIGIYAHKTKEVRLFCAVLGNNAVTQQERIVLWQGPNLTKFQAYKNKVSVKEQLTPLQYVVYDPTTTAILL